MRLACGLLLLLLVPGATAWSADLVSTPDSVSLRESLLLAGSMRGSAPGGVFGAPIARTLAFEGNATIRMCPDRAGQPQPSAGCTGSQDTTGARLYVRAGGLIARPDAEAATTLVAPATAAALGGPNVTVNRIDVGPGIFAGGRAIITSNTTTILLRPLGSLASLEVRGDQGFRTYNGSGYTLFITNITSAQLNARGVFLGGADASLELSRAGLREAEVGIDVVELYELLHAVQPPETADRRADLAESFGPFQIIPALLDGAAAATTNLTLNGAPRTLFTFVRLSDLHIARDEGTWAGSGNATYLVDDITLTPRLESSARFPVVIPVVLIIAALAGRYFTPRDPLRRRGRVWATGLRVGGLVLLGFIAGAALAPLLGFSPLLDARILGLRSRTQLLLLVVSMVGLAWLSVGLASESLTRSLFAWREKARAIVVPVLVGLVATLLFLLLATPVLLSLVARFVRL